MSDGNLSETAPLVARRRSHAPDAAGRDPALARRNTTHFSSLYRDVSEGQQSFGGWGWASMASLEADAVRPSSGNSVRKAVLGAVGVIWLFLAVGLLFYHFWEGWGVIDALYFCIVVLTTVGYGDMAPSDTVSKLFTIAYVVVAVGIILAVVTYLVDLLIETNEQAVARAMAMGPEIPPETEDGFTRDERFGIATSLGSFLFVCVVGGLFFCLVDHLSLIDALYFIVITSSTVGFGDLEPSSEASRAFAVFFLVFSTITLAKTLGEVTAARSAARQRETARKTIHGIINRDVFAELDMDGDGEITRVEFLSAMLIKLGNVDESTVADILAEFDRRDVDQSGFISLNEVGLKASKASYTRLRQQTAEAKR